MKRSFWIVGIGFIALLLALPGSSRAQTGAAELLPGIDARFLSAPLTPLDDPAAAPHEDLLLAEPLFASCTCLAQYRSCKASCGGDLGCEENCRAIYDECACLCGPPSLC